MEADFSSRWRSQTEWSWQVALDLFCGGLGGSLFLVSLWMGSLLGAWVALGLVALAGVVLFSHLSRPMGFWRAFRRPTSSWISRGAMAMTLFIVFGVLALLPGVGGALQSAWLQLGGIGQTLVVLAGVTAALVVLYPGFVLASSPSIPFWQNPLVLVLFATYSVAGAVLLLFLLGEVRPAAAERLVAGVALPLLGANLVLLASYLEVARRSVAAAREAVQWLTRGRLAKLFWLGVVGLGLVVPLVALVVALAVGPGEAAAAVWELLAAVAALIGGFLFRYTLLRAGVYGPPI